MKIFALIAVASAVQVSDDTTLVQPYWTTKDATNNAERYWGKNWEAYREANDDADSNNCKIYESHNWSGAQQCKFSWECRGARSCERGGFCSGWDACVETPFPMQAPGVLPDH